MRRAHHLKQFIVATVVVSLLGALISVTAPLARAQGNDVVINEVLAANSVFLDAFGETSDWVELQNDGDAVELEGWTLTDGDDNAWVLPTTTLDAGEQLLIFASGRNLADPELHSSFSLKSTGETLLLADADGALIDSISYPTLTDDQAWGRDPSGVLGFLSAPTPSAANVALLPSIVTIETPGQTFQGGITISLSATLSAGEEIRYSIDGSAVDVDGDLYDGPFTIERSAVVRTAVVGNGVVGAEASAGYTAVSSTIADFTSNLPIVLVHSSGVVGEETQDAIVTIIEPDIVDGRAGVFETPSYDGFAGMRIRGASSSNFPKKQYKFETWGDQLGTEIDADLLGLGAESDWVLYAPGRFDRAMINNPFMYELGESLGVLAPDYRFVELFIEDNVTATVGDGDYLGLYVLRENIKIGDQRVDLVEHTATSAGPDGGYILRYDWSDDCCSNLQAHPQFGSYIAADSPGAASITANQLSWIGNWWAEVQNASAANFVDADAYIDFDNFLDGWLLEMLAFDVDILRASHYMHKDAGGQLQAGPLWDYDRSLGGADGRVDELAEAEGWTHGAGHSYESDIYGSLWQLPEVQSRLRSRWAELRTAELSDAALADLITRLGGEISEAYVREITVWGDGESYGPRFGNGLTGELEHMTAWVRARAGWLDAQFITQDDRPVVTPIPFTPLDENDPISIQVQAVDAQVMVYRAEGLPVGVRIDQTNGLISGTVGYGDAGTYDVTITVTDSTGAAAETAFTIEVTSALTGTPALVLNEYNAVAPGRLLDAGGVDENLGLLAGNGGDWFELVTLDDNLDMRGWKFDVWFRSDTGQLRQTARLVLADEPLLASIRAGSIITVAESIADDLSYDPADGDWTFNLQANNGQAGSMFANQTDFDTNNHKWRLIVRDASDAVRAEIVGETGPWDAANLGVANDEVFAMTADPSGAADPTTDWTDTTSSSFGSANTVDGVTQDLSDLRPRLGVQGDVNCDSAPGIVDALIIAQYSVGNRTAVVSCPMDDPATQIVLDGADVNGDERVDVVDALLLSQCAVNVDNGFCSNGA